MKEKYKFTLPRDVKIGDTLLWGADTHFTVARIDKDGRWYHFSPAGNPNDAYIIVVSCGERLAVLMPEPKESNSYQNLAADVKILRNLMIEWKTELGPATHKQYLEDVRFGQYLGFCRCLGAVEQVMSQNGL